MQADPILRISSKKKVDGFMKEGIYLFIDSEFNIDSQEYEYLFTKSKWV